MSGGPEAKRIALDLEEASWKLLRRENFLEHDF
jgi:hypothetical protein